MMVVPARSLYAIALAQPANKNIRPRTTEYFFCYRKNLQISFLFKNIREIPSLIIEFSLELL
jgi:hypothetical protein